MKIRYGFISNSSSSSFVCATEMGLKEVEEKLEAIFIFMKEIGIIKASLSLNDVFDKPFIADKQYAKSLGDYVDSEQSKKIIGKIIVESAADNTIPYEIFDLLNTIFNAWRIHLG